MTHNLLSAVSPVIEVSNAVVSHTCRQFHPRMESRERKPSFITKEEFQPEFNQGNTISSDSLFIDYFY